MVDRLIEFFRSAGWQKAVGVAVITAITLTVVAIASVTLTSSGCGLAKSVGLTHIGGRCVAQRSVAALTTPSPIPTPSAHNTPPPQPSPPPSAYPPPASNYPPTDGAASSVPPGLSGVSGYPFDGNASGTGAYPQGMQCSLPLYAGPPGSGGFVTFPGGNFVADPKSAVTEPTPPGASPAPQQGYGPGYSGLAYDRQYSRWLPVPYRQVSPDGAHYAFNYGGAIYAVTVSTDALSELGEGSSWTIIDVKNEGVYAEVTNTAGLWLLPYSGAPRQITTGGFWQAVGGGAAYGTVSSAVPQGAKYTIIRLDLSTGKYTDWFNRGIETAYVTGFDGSGTPLILSSGPNGGTLWLASGPLSGTLIYAPSTNPYSYDTSLNFNGWMVADSRGVWLTGYWSIPYHNSGPFIGLLTNSTLYGLSPLGGQLGGPCV